MPSSWRTRESRGNRLSCTPRRFDERFKSLEGKFATLQWLFGLHFTVSLGILYRLIVAI
jgi:hypothetical protein